MTTYRIALISDLHGNELALRLVLEDIRRTGVDQIACLGDVLTLGPRPREVLAMVRESCDLFILGNHDEYLLDSSASRAHTHSPVVLGAVEQCKSELGAEELDFVRRFERRLTVPLTNGNLLLLFHGSPDSNNCDLLSETPETVLSEHLGDQQATVMAGGHTHIQMLRQHRGRLLVNPGSVGLAFERFVAGAPPALMAHAEYAIVESRGDNVSVALHRVGLDRAELAASVSGWDNPLAGYLAEQYARSTPLTPRRMASASG
ncbi:MAG TPA: metallophosphoesterase family protein [Polyangiaceae bacterium]|nr:metallophosphoesterase family protein [Polyangiaceae bacterium]